MGLFKSDDSRRARRAPAGDDTPADGSRDASSGHPRVREGAPKRRRATATTHSELGEKYIAGVPARIMRPRLVFSICLAAILAFGLLMVYSASAITSLAENGSATYMLGKQAIFIIFGLVVMLFVSGAIPLVPTSLLKTGIVWGVWLALLVSLIVVLFIGTGGDEWGAKRWIDVGFTTVQPAEFAKPLIIMVLAKLFSDYYEDCSTDTASFLISLVICLGIPAFFIIREPDMGTTLIILATACCMLFVAGISRRVVLPALVAGLIGIIWLIFSSDYRRQRFMILLDPWKDPFGDGYQATLSIMAFASGGLFGRGIGNSTMKYHYLPEAHNDYILAIIGEELGFVGTAAFIAVFLCMIGAGILIARRSPTLYGQMLALGCSLCLGIQFFVNALGILGVTPMTGKPVPFVSYGGSSIVASLILAGLILRVSLDSNVRTAADARREGMAVMGEAEDVSGHIGRSTAGEARVRRRGPAPSRRESTLRVYDGGRATPGGSDPMRGRGDASAPRERGRIDLNEPATDRLRRDRGDMRVDYHDISGAARPRRSGEGRPGRPGSHGPGRSRHDR